MFRACCRASAPRGIGRTAAGGLVAGGVEAPPSVSATAMPDAIAATATTAAIAHQSRWWSSGCTVASNGAVAESS
jgi:hypothetical protein